MAKKINVKKYEIADLEQITLFIDDDCAVNGLNESVHTVQNIQEFAKDFQGLVNQIKETGKVAAGTVLFIPDLWHVAYGRAKNMPKEEGDILWGSTTDAHNICRDYGGVQHSMKFRYNHPGCEYRF